MIAMELSEALKAVRFVKPGGDFVLFGHVWAPTAVMLGRASYPTLEQVEEQVRESRGRMHYLDPDRLKPQSRRLPGDQSGCKYGRDCCRARR